MSLNSPTTNCSALADLADSGKKQSVWQPLPRPAGLNVVTAWAPVFYDSRVVLALTFVLISTILFLRRPDTFRNPQFWAEDCFVFFVQQRALGWKACLVAYAGYLHLIPRLVACAGSSVELRWQPTFYNMSALACVLAIAAMILRARLDGRIKALLALALVLVPHDGEVFMNIANIQWMAAPLLLVLALQQNPRSSWQAGLDILALCLLGLTGPFSVLWLPILALRPFAFGRTFYNGLFVGLAIAVASVQFVHMHNLMILMADRVQSSGFPPWSTIAELTVKRFMSYAFLGFAAVSHWHFVILGAVALGTVYLLIVSFGSTRLRGLALCTAAAIVYVSAIPKFAGLITVVSPGTRYLYIPTLLACWFYVLGLSNPRRLARFTAAILMGMMVLAMCRHASDGQMKDLHWEQYAAAIELGESKGETVSIPINPSLTVNVEPRASVRPNPLHGPNSQ